MKITRIGWVNGNEKPQIYVEESGGVYQILNVWSYKGNRSGFLEEEWPPRKIRITVEDVEKK